MGLGELNTWRHLIFVECFFFGGVFGLHLGFVMLIADNGFRSILLTVYETVYVVIFNLSNLLFDRKRLLLYLIKLCVATLIEMELKLIMWLKIIRY